MGNPTTTTKDALGTPWAFDVVRLGPAVVYAIRAGRVDHRVARHPLTVGWTVDRFEMGIWEPYLDGSFTTPRQAAAALVAECGRL